MKLLTILSAACLVGCMCWFGHAQSKKPDQHPIKIDVGPGKAVRVTIPNIAKADLVDLISTFFSKGDEKAKTNFNAVIGKSSAVTLVLTTEVP